MCCIDSIVYTYIIIYTHSLSPYHSVIPTCITHMYIHCVMRVQDPAYASSSASSASSDPLLSYEERGDTPQPDDPIYSAGHNLVIIRKFEQASGNIRLLIYIYVHYNSFYDIILFM